MSAAAFNLARRESVRNEPDLLQVDFFEEATPTQQTYSKRECELLAAKSGLRDIPIQCQEYPSIKSMMLKRNKSTYAIAFAGLSPEDASNAISARESGRLSHAQFQRRLTSHHHTGKW